MPLQLQKIKLEPNEECRVPDLSHSTENARKAGQNKTLLQLNDCGVYNAKTNIKMERGSVGTDLICIKVEARPEMNPDPITKKKTRQRLQMDTIRRPGQNLKRRMIQTEPSSAKPTVTPSGRKGRKKCVQMERIRLLPVPIKPKIVPRPSVPDQQEKLEATKPSLNNLQRSKESITVADASVKFLNSASSMPSGYYVQNQASFQQPALLHPCSLGQQSVLNSCQNPVFIQVCGNQLASSSFNSANQLTCRPVVVPENSVSIQLAGNTVVPGISVMPRSLSLNPQLQLQSSGSTMTNQGSLQIGLPSGQIGLPAGQIVQTLHNSLNSFIPNHLVQGNFQNPIHVQMPANQVIQTNSQNQVQINFPSNQLIQNSIQNPIHVQIPSTKLVCSGSQNTVQISSPSNQLVQNSIQIQFPARHLLQTNSKVPCPTPLPTLQSKKSTIELKSPVSIKAKLPSQSVTIPPNSLLIQNSTGHADVQTCSARTNLKRDLHSQSSSTCNTRSKPLIKVAMAKVSRKPRKPKYSTRANISSKVAAETQKPVRIQPHSMDTPKFIPIQPSINQLPQHLNPQNSLQVVSCNTMNAVQHQFPLQQGVSLCRTVSNPSFIKKPTVIQQLETSKSSTSTFRIVTENHSQTQKSGTTIELRLLDSSKSLARTKLQGRALQRITTRIPENSRLCKIAIKQLNTNKSVLPKHDSSKTNCQHPNSSSGHQLRQATLPDCEVAQISDQLTFPSSSLPTYTIVTSGSMNLPNAQVLRTCSQISAPSERSLQGVYTSKNQVLDISPKETKETVIVLGTSDFNKPSHAQCFSVSVPNIINSVSQSTNIGPQRKAKSKYVPILPRSSDNQMCIFNQTANDKGSFWGAGKMKVKLVRKAVKRTAAAVQESCEDEQELLADQECFVQLEMLNIEPNKFYCASDFKRAKSSNLKTGGRKFV